MNNHTDPPATTTPSRSPHRLSEKRGFAEMPECGACGRHVSGNYVRVFGDSSGTVSDCPVCAADTVSGVG